MRLINVLKKTCVYGISILFLVGCSEDKDNIDTWIKETRVNARPKVVPLPPMTEFVPYVHQVGDGYNPFDPRRLRSEQSGNVDANAPDANRPKEYLEAVALTEMKLVGTIKDKGREQALVSVGGEVHQLRIGHYLGQDFGRIIKISNAGIVIREQIQEGTGKWIFRDTEIPITTAQ